VQTVWILHREPVDSILQSLLYIHVVSLTLPVKATLVMQCFNKLSNLQTIMLKYHSNKIHTGLLIKSMNTSCSFYHCFIIIMVSLLLANNEIEIDGQHTKHQLSQHL